MVTIRTNSLRMEGSIARARPASVGYLSAHILGVGYANALDAALTRCGGG